jgi:hypothetical protein
VGGNWKLAGLDTFSGDDYPLGDVNVVDGRSTLDGMRPEYETYEEALADARQRLADLERTQPSASSGGQGFNGIQDRVYVVHPDGIRERVIVIPPAGRPAGDREKFWRMM